MFFTQEDFKKIEQYLKLNSRKDTDFDAVSFSDVKPTDWVAIILKDPTGGADHINAIVSISDLNYATFRNIIYGEDERGTDIIEEIPTKDSGKLVKSNGIWHAINDPKVIQEHQLDDNTVSTRTIIDANVTHSKLSDDSVEGNNIKNGEVTSPKLGQDVITRFNTIESDAQELHRKTEKLTTYLAISKSGAPLPNGTTLEITGDENTISMTGTARVETYGDEPSQSIAESEMESKRLTVIRNGTTLFDMAVVSAEYTLPDDKVGAYNIAFTTTYNNVSRSASSTVNLNLRKYFGFASSQPTDPTTLSTSYFSNSVGCTVTIPANGTGFKYIYFAVPYNMSITNIIQPDALNAPLAFSQIGTISRTISGNTYQYKLYKSVDLINSSISKRLTIS